MNRMSVLLLMATLLVGCSRFDDQYGETKGTSGAESVNGFGAFRSLLEQDFTAPVAADAAAAVTTTVRTRNLMRLSNREQNTDAIVWIPKSWPPANEPEITEWMQVWLEQGERTLVFIVPDEGSTEEYFHDAAELAPAEQRLAYRRRLAKQINERLMNDAERKSLRVGNWFGAAALPYRTRLANRRVCDFDLQPVVKSGGNAHTSTTWNATTAAPEPGDDESVQHSWEDAVADSLATTGSTRSQGRSQNHEFESLREESGESMTAARSVTTLARVTNPAWHDSQVLVVASGGLLTNFAMTAAPAQDMVATIQRELHLFSPPSEDTRITMAFLSTDDSVLPISSAKAGLPRSKGWELMTEMPLGLINMHAAFLGIVVCLMLLPIFGRPRRLRHNRTTNFGNHLSAMATLMRRGGGEHYAQQRISDYLRKIRGETSGPWVLPESPSDHDSPQGGRQGV